MPDEGGAFHFVVLAGQRKGQVNPLARAAGVSHKCIIEMVGKPLIAHVLDAIDESGLARKITVSIEDETVLDGVAAARALRERGLLHVVPAQDNLFTSVAAALPAPDDFPAVVTTADNVLMTAESARYFCEHAAPHEAAVGLVRKEVLQSKYPDGQKNFHRFRDGEFSNCNMYFLGGPNALAAAELFRGGGQFAKASKWRVAKAVGVINMLAYKYAWFTRDEVLARVGRRFGVQLAAVDLPFPEAPIDVDNERTRDQAQEILEARLAG